MAQVVMQKDREVVAMQRIEEESQLKKKKLLFTKHINTHNDNTNAIILC